MINRCQIVTVCLLIFAGCATAPERPTYADIHAKYEALKQPAPERIIFEFDPVCNDSGECLVSESRLNDAARVITLLNDTVASYATANNNQLSAIAHIEFSMLSERARADYIEQSSQRGELISSIKQLLTVGASAAGIALFCRP